MAERRESVRVTASASGFSREFGAMKRDAAELQAALRSIPNNVHVRASSSGFDKVERDALRASRSSSALLDSIVMLSPAVVGLGAAAVPALVGLSTQLGLTAGAAGVAVLAFQGVGDALKAVEQARVAPTAANLEKMHVALEALGPAGRHFVETLDRLRPAFKEIQDAARAGLFPGIESSLVDLESRLPQVQQVVSGFAKTTGDLMARAGADLAGSGWDDFFNWLESAAQPILLDFGRSLGNVGKSIANMMVAFSPLSSDFSSGFLSQTQRLVEWSSKLGQSQGFASFIDYVRESGPQVAETLGKIGNAFVQLAQAAAPVSGPVLKAIGGMADLVATIADSPAGTALVGLAVGLTAVNRAMAISATMKDSFVAQLLGGGSGSITSRIDKARTGMRSYAIEVDKAGFALQQAQKRQAAASVAARDAARATRDANFAMLPPPAKQAVMISARRDYAAAVKQGQVAANQAALATQRLAMAEAKQSAATRARIGTMGKAAGAGALLAASMTGLADKAGASNMANLALAGTMAGPLGTAAGAAVGGFMDLKAAFDDATAGAKALDGAIKSGSLSQVKQSLADIRAGQDKIENPEGIKKYFSTLGQVSGFGVLSKTFDHFAKSKNEDAIKRATAAIKAMNMTAQQSSNVRGVFDALPAGLSKTTSEFQKATSASSQFYNSLQKFNASLSLRGALRSYEQALDEVSAAAKKNGQNLDISTQAGRENQQMLDNFAQGVLTAASQMGELDQANFLAKSRGQFIRAAQGMGMARIAAANLADELGLVDRRGNVSVKVKAQGIAKAGADAAKLGVQLGALGKKKASPKADLNRSGFNKGRAQVNSGISALDKRRANPRAALNKGAFDKGRAQVNSGISALDRRKATPNVALIGAGAAIGAANGVTSAINRIPSRKESFVTTVFTTIKKAFNQAEGGFHPQGLQTFAQGGIVRRSPAQFLGPGPSLVQWREPETRGESYIPHANDHRRPRAIEIWEQTGRALGIRFERYAEGAFRAAYQAAPISVSPHVAVGSPKVALGDTNVAVMIDGRALDERMISVVMDYADHDNSIVGAGR